MEIRVLRYFVEAAREENITKAAAYLHISQPTLSKHLKDLEQELGTRLLNRSSSGITLTESGRYLQEHLEDFLQQYYSIRRGIQSIGERERHEIDLLSAYGILRLVTPECLADFQSIRTSRWSASLPLKRATSLSPSAR